jgi:uncharacterized membrane protein HdeD (DUF308 family)
MTNFDPYANRPRATDLPSVPVLECPAGRWWVCALLGAVLVAIGVFIFFNVVAASIVSAIFFAAALIVGGAFQVGHGFFAEGWTSKALSIVVGLLFVLGGALLMTNPLATSLGLTLGIATILIASGIVRLVLAYRHWGDYGWVLLASGLLGIITGAVFIFGFPWSGLIVPGMLLGIDFIFHGAWWLTLGFVVRRARVQEMGSGGVAHAVR